MFDKSRQTLHVCPAGKPGSYVVPDGVTNITPFAFSYCHGLITVTIPNSVVSVGDHCFYSSASLMSVALPEHLSAIKDSTFLFCTSLTNVTIPNSVTSIDRNPFADCASLVDVRIPDSVSQVGEWAFFECSSLATVTMGNGVTNLGREVFSRCPNFEALYARGNRPTTSGGGLFYQSSNWSRTYYLPGTMGWDLLFPLGNLKSLWLPQILAADNNFGPGTNGFGFNILWTSGMTVIVEKSTRVTAALWVPVATNSLTSDFSYFSDPTWTDSPARFYRLRWL